MSIFIPKKINVGFVNRSGTYDGKLSYIIYFDEKGTLRKEASWQSWRDKSIPNIISDNIPTEGFVLNKKAGGYSTGWNHRNTYIRVYDPRGFEFEITVPNLLYILENTNSIKGKGLEGKFIYGWDGKDLLLVPVDSPDYQEISKVNEIIHNNNSIKGKDLKIGATYKTKDNQDWVYLGKFDKWNGWIQELQTNKGKHFYFYRINTEYDGFEIQKTLTNKIISIVDENPYFDYANIMDKLEYEKDYSPIDRTKDEYILYDLDKIKKEFTCDHRTFKCYTKDENKFKEITIGKHYDKGYSETLYDVYIYVEKKQLFSSYSRTEKQIIFTSTLEEIYNEYQPHYLNIYLQNGNLYQEEY